MISFANTKRVCVRYKDTRCCGEVNDQNERVRLAEIPDEKPRERKREGVCDFRLVCNFRVPPLHRVGQGKMDVPFATLTPVVPL